MHLQVKITQNDRNMIFRDKKTKSKIPPIFLDVKVLAER